MNLFLVAAENAEALQSDLETLRMACAPEEGERLDRFSGRVQRDGRISMNMRQTTLTSFLVFRVHQNVHEWASSKAEESGRPEEEILREKLKDYYGRRVVFDRSFEGGESFRYGALNIGGLGTKPFGEYCVVLSDAVSAGRVEVAYLRADSLKTCFQPGPTLDEEIIRRNTAPHSHRQCLAVLKHADHLAGCPEDGWPALLCSESDWVEAIFIGPLTPSDVELVRMPRSDFRFRFHYAFEEFRGGLDEADRSVAEYFAIVYRLMKNLEIPLEGL